MQIVVQKYGGSSVATPESLKGVAERVRRTREEGKSVVVVVSAMGGQTDHLLELAHDVSGTLPARELDMLLSSGERVSAALLAMALEDLGIPALSLSGEQCSIVTDRMHANATIEHIEVGRVRRELADGKVVVVAGFQGITPEGEVTTLGRGGSDTSAVALAAALDAVHCEICSDVDGVYSADPRVVPTARRLDSVSYEEMCELSRHGARVLHSRAVELASRENVSIWARSTFGGDAATVIHGEASGPGVSGVAGRTDVIRVAALDPAALRTMPEAVGAALGDVDIICAADDRADAIVALENVLDPDGLRDAIADASSGRLAVVDQLASVAAVGRGLGAHPDLLAHAKRVLADAGIPLTSSFVSSDAFACIVPLDAMAEGMRRIHDALIDMVPA